MSQPNISNVFVLMLENHSFDNIFAMSGIPGIRAATLADSNWYCGKEYFVKDGAPESMPTDPGHEFEDVLEQLTGRENVVPYLMHWLQSGGKQKHPRGLPYPPIDLSGFASNYATSTTEKTGTPQAVDIGDIMACFNTAKQLPVIHELATQFAICDNWFSSLPGPTWPNRFFVHGATSMGFARSPSLGEEFDWELFDGFSYEKGSIFQALTSNNKKWRLYNDRRNRFSDDPSPWWEFGWIPQVAALKGVHLWDVHSLDQFKDDLNNEDGYPYSYTFIEPNYGESVFDTYKGGSSQHPEDDPTGGEGLIKYVYEAIRNSPVWNTSLLIVTYDEHGGFYDSVKPGKAVPPDGNVSDCGFDFGLYGVRVPAVIVSPLIPPGTVSSSVYDHTSILKTLETVLGMDHLTARDENANHVLDLLTLTTPRECPTQLPVIPIRERAPLSAQMVAERSAQPLPSFGNLIGFIQVLLKANLTLCGEDQAARRAAYERFQKVTSLGEAQEYFQSLMPKIEEAAQKQSEIDRR